jgi:hypothetical protein
MCSLALTSTRRRCAPAACDVSVCPVLPTLPAQGGVMPVLWQPSVQTDLHLADLDVEQAYTLLLITTQWIDVGVVLRFQMWAGETVTYLDAVEGGGLTQWDLVVSTAIPPGTVVVANMAETGTALWNYTGSTAYSTGGAGLPLAAFQERASLLCFAFVPTTSGLWAPATGEPMFAIGFNHPPAPQMGTACAEPQVGAEATAPNFPDQYSDDPRWTFVYEVVYPAQQTVVLGGSTTCATALGIKFQQFETYGAFPVGSWSNLREIIAQPWTVLKDNAYSTSRWVLYSLAEAIILADAITPNPGPFTLTAAAGQLVPVYWRPRYKDIDTDTTPIQGNLASDWAELAVLVTMPLYPGTAIYFTNDEYNSASDGFGPRRTDAAGATFITQAPYFTWRTGCAVIPAGTVVLFTGIGGSTVSGPSTANPTRIVVVNAHDTDNAGSVGFAEYADSLTAGNQAVTSLIAMGIWITQGIGAAKPITAGSFVCAALSDQYAGDFPNLSPGLTIHKDRFVGQVVYGLNRVIDNQNLPAPVQAPMINSADFTELDWADVVFPGDLPRFCGMACYKL